MVQIRIFNSKYIKWMDINGIIKRNNDKQRPRPPPTTQHNPTKRQKRNKTNKEDHILGQKYIGNRIKIYSYQTYIK